MNTAKKRITRFSISNSFISNARLKLAKTKQMISNDLRLSFCYLKIIHILHPRYHPKIIVHILKNKQKNKRSHRYDINRPRSRHEHKCSKCKKCPSMVMLICIKQHPKVHFKLNSLESYITLKLSWKQGFLIKKAWSQLTFTRSKLRRKARKRCEICSELTIKTPERRQLLLTSNIFHSFF